MVDLTMVPQAAHGKGIEISLWVAQGLVSAMFCLGAFMKLAMPVDKLSKRMPWMGQVSPSFLRFSGLVDLAGGVGILVPALVHVLPGLTAPAALGCAVVQVLAIGFHARRGEISQTPINFFLLALSLFVFWGR